MTELLVERVREGLDKGANSFVMRHLGWGSVLVLTAVSEVRSTRSFFGRRRVEVEFGDGDTEEFTWKQLAGDRLDFHGEGDVSQYLLFQ